MAVVNGNKDSDHIPDSDISRSKEELLDKKAKRAEAWRKIVEQNMREGETFEEVDQRLYKEAVRQFVEQHGLFYPVRMPQHPATTCAMPNGMLWSALFGAIGKGRRRFLRRELIASMEDTRIKYTGERLDQGDLDVYQAVLHHLRSCNMGEWCYVTGYSLLKLIGKTDTGKNRDILHNRLIRLCANSVEIKHGPYTYMGSLIHEACKNNKTKEWMIVLNPRLRFLFEPNQFTLTDWKIRRKLSLSRQSSSLAQWLYGFYSTHAEPYSIRIETLRELCGSEMKLIKHFKAELNKALDAVVEAFNDVGQYFSYEIKDGLVHVRKQPSRSQQRYLERKNQQ